MTEEVDDFGLFQVWDGTSDALITFNRPDFAGDVAYIVENDVLLYAIEKEIRKNPNVTIQNNSNIEQVRLACDGHYNNKVYLKSGEVFSAELLVSKYKKRSQFIRRILNKKIHNFAAPFKCSLVITTKYSVPIAIEGRQFPSQAIPSFCRPFPVSFAFYSQFR